MTDDVKQDSVMQKVAEPKKVGSQLVIWLFLLVLIGLAATGGFVYTMLTKQHASLVQQVMSLQQQSSDDVTQLQALAHTVQQLQQANSVNDNQDITTIYTHLIAVNSQLDQLPLPSAPLQPETAAMPAVDDSQLSWWENGLNRSMRALRQIVIIRYSENKTSPLITPEDRHFLYLNLHAEMQNAIWGVLHRNPEVYHTSLARVMNWVQQYFVQTSPITATVMQQLSALQAVDVRAQDSNRGAT